MMEEEVIDKLRKIALVRYEGFPESVRDFVVQVNYFVYLPPRDKCDEEWLYHETKGEVVDMWFEGKFNMRDHLLIEDLQNLAKFVHMQYEQAKAKEKAKEAGICDEDEEEEPMDYSPPPESDADRKAKVTYIR